MKSDKMVVAPPLCSQAVKQNSGSSNAEKAPPSRSGPVKKESIGAQYRHHPLRARRRPPKGMHLDQTDITALSTSHDAGVLSVRQLDTHLVSLKRQVGSRTAVRHWCPECAAVFEIYSEV